MMRMLMGIMGAAMNDDEKIRLIQKCGNDIALIADSVGLDKAMELATIFQGDRVSFPKHIVNELRNSAIRKEYEELRATQWQTMKVFTIKFLASKYDMSTRTIERIINKADEISD